MYGREREGELQQAIPNICSAQYDLGETSVKGRFFRCQFGSKATRARVALLLEPSRGAPAAQVRYTRVQATMASQLILHLFVRMGGTIAPSVT